MDNTEIYELSKALPNKLLNADGSITDFQGNIISPANEVNAQVFKNSKAIANKFMNQNGSSKTYAEISLDIFTVVDTLPEEGEKNRIYLIPAKDGMFDEYFYNENHKWDKLGEVTVDLSGYPTKTEMSNAIASNSVSDREYTDNEIKKSITTVLGGKY